eukprot:COSAG04_NODE_515_length_13209_cov_19.059115_4_plen_87_part_00
MKIMVAIVSVSLLSAGSTVFGVEMEGRKRPAPGEMGKLDLSIGSRYGVVGVLLRTAQAAAMVFWIALLSCAEKGWAGFRRRTEAGS